MRPTFKIILFARKVAGGKQPVMLRATYDRESKYFSLNRYALPKEWDKAACRFRRSHPDHKRENEILRTLEQRAADILFDWERANIAFSFSQFERLMFADRQAQTATAWEYTADIADSRTTEGYLNKFENAALDGANAAILSEVAG